MTQVGPVGIQEFTDLLQQVTWHVGLGDQVPFMGRQVLLVDEIVAVAAGEENRQVRAKLLQGIVDLLPQGNCCLEVCTDDPGEHQEEEECSDICNPFLSCQCCLGFTATPDGRPSGAGLTSYGSRNDHFRQLHSSQVILPVWHPPKG